MKQQPLFYEERFLESWVGPIINDPLTAIVELVANCWDAYSTEVYIEFPSVDHDCDFFSIRDNGRGMLFKDFEYIWRALSYDRIAHHGKLVVPPEGVLGSPRRVFGQNGKGRFATFCFSDKYRITSAKNGKKFSCIVQRTPESPLLIGTPEKTECDVIEHGTEICCIGSKKNILVTENQVREYLGGRFLADPSFKVIFNGSKITFNDLSDSSLSPHTITVDGYGKCEILHIDSKTSSRTSKQHGIAWWVSNRAVGECKWRGSDYKNILDRRTSEAKRFTFIVKADFLNDANAVKEDWSWFKKDNHAWQSTYKIVQDKINEIISETEKSGREYKKQYVLEKAGQSINTLPLLSKDRVKLFVNNVINECPNFGENEIFQLATILTKLEKAKSRYGLLELLHNQDPKDYDALHQILSDWTIGMAKIVLDEIETRLRLISELKSKLDIKGVNEVKELQPLFEKGLWMFGPQFESIEFTSNKGMTTVIRELFSDKDGHGSRNRPDFVILDDSSIGFYARSSYDEEFNENGIEHVVIIDLKTTGLPIGSNEKGQVWKYVKELGIKGYITKSTSVDGFILGDTIEQGETEPRKEGNRVRIIPLLYDTILSRAEKRLLNLHSKVKDAPFLQEQQEELEDFSKPIKVKQEKLFNCPVS